MIKIKLPAQCTISAVGNQAFTFRYGDGECAFRRVRLTPDLDAKFPGAIMVVNLVTGYVTTTPHDAIVYPVRMEPIEGTYVYPEDQK